MTFTVAVPVGYSLAVATDSSTTGTYQQTGDNVTHSPTFMGVNSAVVLGPYAAAMTFDLTSKTGNICYSLSTAAPLVETLFNALVASTQP